MTRVQWTHLDIANAALAIERVGKINTFGDDMSDWSHFLGLVYFQTLEEEIVRAPYRFTNKKQVVAPDADYTDADKMAYASVENWTYRYTKPADCLKVLNLGVSRESSSSTTEGLSYIFYPPDACDGEGRKFYDYFGSKFFCQYKPVVFDYQFRPEAHEFPAVFRRVMIESLRQRISSKAQGGGGYEEIVRTRFHERAVASCLRTENQQAPPQHLPLRSRFGRSRRVGRGGWQ